MSEELSREEVRRRVRERAGKPAQPAPARTPVTNLLLADIVMRIGTSFLRSGVERALLTNRYGEDAASDMAGKPSLLRRLGAAAAARFATRSVPGAAIVGTGIAGKLLYDGSKKRRANQRQDNAVLPEQAAEDTDTPGT